MVYMAILCNLQYMYNILNHMYVVSTHIHTVHDCTYMLLKVTGVNLHCPV